MPSGRSRPKGRPTARPKIRRNPRRSNLLDIVKSPRDAPRLFGRGLLTLYRYTLSWLVGSRCRHLPTCSEYADQAIERFGLWAGGWVTVGGLPGLPPFGTGGGG